MFFSSLILYYIFESVSIYLKKNLTCKKAYLLSNFVLFFKFLLTYLIINDILNKKSKTECILNGKG